MNAVPLTPAELLARNEQAKRIVADCNAKPQARQIAAERLLKDAAK